MRKIAGLLPRCTGRYRQAPEQPGERRFCPPAAGTACHPQMQRKQAAAKRMAECLYLI